MSKHQAADAAVITVEEKPADDQTAGTMLTVIGVTENVEVGVFDKWIHVWDGKREVRLGPLTADQAEQLSDDLGYEATA
jgi:hypothetical protein